MRPVTFFAALAAGLLASAGSAATYHGTLTQCAQGQQLQLRAGQRYVISANSSDFDPVLRILRRGATEVLAENDDGGEGTNSRLSFTPPQAGTYIACVASYGATGSGAFTIDVEEAAARAPPVARPCGTEAAAWQVFDGTLGEGDQDEGGNLFDDYQITLPAGQRALISLESPSFDTLVKVYRADQRGGEVAATDDDGGGHLNSFLMFAPDDGGDYIVRVTSFGAHSGGAYRLKVLEMPIPPGPPEQPADAEAPSQGD
jgi:hypothetical protein